MSLDADFPRPRPTWVVAAAAWVGLALTFAPALSPALANASAPLRIGGDVAFWALYLMGAVAIFVPRPLGLVVLRLGAWMLVVAGIVLGVAATGTQLGWRILAPASALVVFVLQMLPSVGDREMDGASYPGERRFGLRFPREAAGGVMLAVFIPTFAVADLLVALGASGFVRIVCATGAVVFGAASYFALRQLHLLARRAMVFTPRNLVALDPYRLSQALAIPYGHLTDLAPVEGGRISPDDAHSGPTKGLLDLRSGWSGPWVQILCDEMSEPPAPRELPVRLASMAPEVPKIAVGVAAPVTDLERFLQTGSAKGLPVTGLVADDA